MGYLKYIAETYKGLRNKVKDKENKELRDLVMSRKKSWRESKSVEKIDRPLRIDKARQYGYKAKQGFVVTRVKVRRGGMRKSRPVKGRRPKRAGIKKITPKKYIKKISEERDQSKIPNLEVLVS